MGYSFRDPVDGELERNSGSYNPFKVLEILTLTPSRFGKGKIPGLSEVIGRLIKARHFGFNVPGGDLKQLNPEEVREIYFSSLVKVRRDVNDIKRYCRQKDYRGSNEH